MNIIAEIFQVAGAVIISLGGAGAVLWGLSSFLSRVWANRILEQDRAKYVAQFERLKNDYQRDLERLKGELETERQKLQVHLDRAVYVHRVQFEKEFAALSEIWKCIAELRAVFEALSMRSRDAAGDAEYMKRIDDLVNPKFYAFLNAVDQQSPFFPENIVRACSEAINGVRVEIKLAVTESPRDVDDYFRVRREARQTLEARANNISDVIRARLASLVVLEQDDEAPRQLNPTPIVPTR